MIADIGIPAANRDRWSLGFQQDFCHSSIVSRGRRSCGKASRAVEGGEALQKR